jgi:hypothetical protein
MICQPPKPTFELLTRNEWTATSTLEDQACIERWDLEEDGISEALCLSFSQGFYSIAAAADNHLGVFDFNKRNPAIFVLPQLFHESHFLRFGLGSHHDPRGHQL